MLWRSCCWSPSPTACDVEFVRLLPPARHSSKETIGGDERMLSMEIQLNFPSN